MTILKLPTKLSYHKRRSEASDVCESRFYDKERGRMVALKLGHILFKNQFDFDAINLIHRDFILKILIGFSFNIII